MRHEYDHLFPRSEQYVVHSRAFADIVGTGTVAGGPQTPMVVGACGHSVFPCLCRV